MALSRDEATQEHAVEAIAELLTIPAIQVWSLIHVQVGVNMHNMLLLLRKKMKYHAICYARIHLFIWVE